MSWIESYILYNPMMWVAVLIMIITIWKVSQKTSNRNKTNIVTKEVPKNE